MKHAHIHTPFCSSVEIILAFTFASKYETNRQASVVQTDVSEWRVLEVIQKHLYSFMMHLDTDQDTATRIGLFFFEDPETNLLQFFSSSIHLSHRNNHTRHHSPSLKG